MIKMYLFIIIGALFLFWFVLILISKPFSKKKSAPEKKEDDNDEHTEDDHPKDHDDHGHKKSTKEKVVTWALVIILPVVAVWCFLYVWDTYKESRTPQYGYTTGKQETKPVKETVYLKESNIINRKVALDSGEVFDITVKANQDFKYSSPATKFQMYVDDELRCEDCEIGPTAEGAHSWKFIPKERTTFTYSVINF